MILILVCGPRYIHILKRRNENIAQADDLLGVSTHKGTRTYGGWSVNVRSHVANASAVSTLDMSSSIKQAY